MKTYLIVVEAGKNNIGGSALYIERDSHIFKADNVAGAVSAYYDMGVLKNIYIFGHDPDYQTIIDIKEIESS